MKQQLETQQELEPRPGGVSLDFLFWATLMETDLRLVKHQSGAWARPSTHQSCLVNSLPFSSRSHLPRRHIHTQTWTSTRMLMQQTSHAKFSAHLSPFCYNTNLAHIHAVLALSQRQKTSWPLWSHALVLFLCVSSWTYNSPGWGLDYRGSMRSRLSVRGWEPLSMLGLGQHWCKISADSWPLDHKCVLWATCKSWLRVY